MAASPDASLRRGGHREACVGAGRETDISIRRITAIEDYRQCESLQVEVWGPDDIVGVPLLDLLTAQDNGRLAGFVYSFLGLTDAATLKHCSVLLAVSPEFRGRGIGWALKMAQRDSVLRQGIDLITWTFDPLMSVNASLNIAKLGGIARDYIENVYGTGQGLNAGLDTDRLLVEWRLSDRPSSDRARGIGGTWEEAVPVNRVRFSTRSGLASCDDVDITQRAPVLRVHIPRDIRAIKEADLAQASQWREATRQLFAHYLASGYVVRDFQADRPQTRGAPFFILTHGSAPHDMT